MQKSTMSKEGAFQIKRPVILGLLGIVVIFLLMLISSVLISRSILPEGRGELIGWVCLFAGSLAAGMLSALKAKAKRAAYALISGGVIFFAVLMANVLNKNSSVFNVNLLINFVIVLVGSLLGSITSVKRPKKRRRH